MSSDERSFPDWLPTLVVLAAAVAFIVADPAGLATQLASHEFAAFRAFRDAADPAHSVTSIPAQILFLEFVGAALLLLIAMRKFLWAVAVALTAALAAQASSWLLYLHLGAFFDTANASIAVLLAATAGLFVLPFRKEEARPRVAPGRRAQRNSPGAPDAAPAPPAAGGVSLISLSCGLRRSAAVARFFEGDVAAFMRVVESVMTPLMEDAVAHGARISRSDGASFSARWPASGNGAQAGLACDAAGRMLAELGKVNERLALQWPQGESPCPLVEIGIGLTTGKHLTGAFRAGGRTEICLVAEDSITDERLRCLSERYGSAVLASQALCTVAEQAHAFLEVDYLVLDPGAAPVRLYAMLGNALTRASPKFRAIATFHEHVFQSIRTRQWDKARGLIGQARRISGANQKLYDLHLARIAWYEGNLPPPDWDGAFRPPLQ